jgi:hypothetical protein
MRRLQAQRQRWLERRPPWPALCRLSAHFLLVHDTHEHSAGTELRQYAFCFGLDLPLFPSGRCRLGGRPVAAVLRHALHGGVHPVGAVRQRHRLGALLRAAIPRGRRLHRHAASERRRAPLQPPFRLLLTTADPLLRLLNTPDRRSLSERSNLYPRTNADAFHPASPPFPPPNPACR